MRNNHLVYEIHSLEVDISVRDTRISIFRTASRWIRPSFSFCFVPGADLVLAYSLSAAQPDQHTLAALLYAAFTPSPAKPYGGMPDEVWFDGLPGDAPTLQQIFDHLGIPARYVSPDSSRNGNVERFVATLKKAFWDLLLDLANPEEPESRKKIEGLTLHHLDGMLESYLIASNQMVHDESEVSPLTAWQTSYSPKQADPSQLAGLLSEWLPRTVMRDGISYQGRRYWHKRFATLAPGTVVSLRSVPSFSVSSPETIEVFFQTGWLCSLAVQR